MDQLMLMCELDEDCLKAHAVGVGLLGSAGG